MYKGTISTLYLLAFLLFSSQAISDANSHRAVIEKILETLNIDKTTEMMLESLKEQRKAELDQLNLSPEAKKLSNELDQKIETLTVNALGWKNLKEKYVELYMTNVTEKEAKAILKFYKSKTGKILLEKTPILTSEAMKIGQEQQILLQPKISKLLLEHQRALQELNHNESASINAEIEKTQGIIFSCQYEESDYVSQDVCSDSAKYLRNVKGLIVQDGMNNDNPTTISIAYEHAFPIFTLKIYTNSTDRSTQGKYLVGILEISVPLINTTDKWEQNPFNQLENLGGNLVIATGYVNALGTEMDVGEKFLTYFKDTSLKLIDYYHESHTYK